VPICYETAGTLVLREVLRPAQVPQHMALVRQHGDSIAKHLAGLSCKANPDAAAAKGKRGTAATAAGAENQPPEGARRPPLPAPGPSCWAARSVPARLRKQPQAGPNARAAAAGAGTQEDEEEERGGEEEEGEEVGGSQQPAVKQEAGAGRPKRAKREGSGEAGMAPLVGGRRVGRGEYALCDLSQADPAPGWSVHKRLAEPAEEVEV
jgi:hypothetical protein